MPRTIEIVDQDHALALDHGPVGVVFHPHAEFADGLGRLNEGAPDIVVADDAEFERQAALSRVADRRRNPQIGHRHDDVGVGRRLARQFRPHRLAGVVDGSTMHDRIGPGEVDVFEDAGPRRLPRQGKEALRPVGVDHDHLAVLDVADEFRADDIERAGFRAEDRAAVEFAEHQRTNAERVARADQLLVGQRYEGVGAFDLGQRLDEAIDDPRPARARREQQHDLGVGCRLAYGACANEFAPERQPVGQVAVVGDCEAARLEFGEQRLDVAQRRLAGRRIAHMADGRPAGQPIDRRGAGEVVAHQALATLGMEPRSIECDDAGRLLSAMLKGVQTERHDRRRIGMVEDAKDTAFLMQPVFLEIDA